MKDSLPLEEHKKLMIQYKMEPGCLGPQGESLVDEYCRYAQEKIDSLNGDFVHWVIEPRSDKKDPEIKYQINGKDLLPAMVERYLAVFGRDLEEFEDQFNEQLMDYIEDFMGR